MTILMELFWLMLIIMWGMWGRCASYEGQPECVDTILIGLSRPSIGTGKRSANTHARAVQRTRGIMGCAIQGRQLNYV